MRRKKAEGRNGTKEEEGLPWQFRLLPSPASAFCLLPYFFCLLVTASSLVFAQSGAGAAGKRVYISVDMEGISGVSGSDQTSSGGSEYGRARKLMAADANAAIAGAFAGAAGRLVRLPVALVTGDDTAIDEVRGGCRKRIA